MNTLMSGAISFVSKIYCVSEKKKFCKLFGRFLLVQNKPPVFQGILVIIFIAHAPGNFEQSVNRSNLPPHIRQHPVSGGRFKASRT